MWIILGLLFFGTITGYILSKARGVNRISEGIVRYTIFILLFFIGVTVGMNREITANIGEIGLHSFLITGFCILGSVFVAKIVFLFFFSKHEK